jgi:hypothetical protein
MRGRHYPRPADIGALYATATSAQKAGETLGRH